MLTIALTGGIGSGKTTVTELFSQLHIPVIDADSIARDLLSGSIKQPANQALLQVRELFGKEFFDAKGCLKRGQLRRVVFSSTTKKQQLEALLHPLVYQQIFHLIDTIKAPSPPYVIIAIPLLLETRQQHRFDKVLIIDTSAEQQLERTLKRDNSSAETIHAIIDSQVDRQTRLKAADYIIENTSSLTELKKQVTQLHHLLVKESKT